MARTPNDYGSGPQHTPPNPSQRGMAAPTLPPSHRATVSPGPTMPPTETPQQLADRVRGGRDPSNGDERGADGRAASPVRRR